MDSLYDASVFVRSIETRAGIHTVSYTHLDVYKRQLQTCIKFYRMLKEHPYEVAHIHSDVAYKLLLYGLTAKIGGVTVSYTHLDVYKRQ